MKFRSLASLVVSVVLILTAFSAFAANPANGSLSGQKDEAVWNGGPFYVSNPTTTAGLIKQGPCDLGAPACDSYRLTVESGVKQVLVAIAPAQGFEADDYDLYIYDDKGNQVSMNADGDGYESAVFDNTGAAYYDIRVQPYVIGAGSSYSGVAQPTRRQPVDVVTECLEVIPENIALPIGDTGQAVDLSVLLLLDGTDAAAAQQLMAKAAASYKPLNINLVLKGTKDVLYNTTISSELITAAKTTVGGKPPKGIDIVGVFTNKEMQAATGGAGTVVGQADCIGGIRWDQTSFFVFSDIRDIENPTTGTTGTLNSMGLNPNVDAAAEVLAHEIGHLMGAHHHYANCVEGQLTSAGAGDVSPCTLMFPMVNFASLNFAALDGAVVRGHAVNHATP
ncbi:MAG TPA: zinc-dependent metalloprotease family protein [Thermoanaerobaculia bacterium]|nr:zinc-dependent metalloprotease family protein [Thermoanaerobaculia bacterium]